MTDKKTAALTPSAPTDDGQLLKKYAGIVSKKEEKSNPNSTKTEDELQEYLKKLTRMQDPNYLHTISMEELFDTVYEEKPAIIEGFLYAGAYLFAGAPKVGKSFFMSQLAYHVSTGQPLWEQKVKQGTVLYLALEDDYKRLQNRLYRNVWGRDHTGTALCHWCKTTGFRVGGTDYKVHTGTQRDQIGHHRYPSKSKTDRKREL